MTLAHRLTRRAARQWARRSTLRLRLTAIYGGLFLLCGAALLAISYGLVSNATSSDCYHAGGAMICIRSPHPGHPAGGGSTTTRGTPGSGAGAPSPGQAQALAASQHASLMHELLLFSGIALAIMAVASAGLGWLVAGRVLRPLRTITAAAQEISATSLHRRLALDGPADELRELGDTFDSLLARLEAAFLAQRQFVANASHELRTPLAWQRTLVQVALADPDADAAALRAAHERVLASGAHLERIIEALLTLTRGQAGLDKREPFDVAGLAARVLSAREAQAQDRHVAVHSSLAPALASGDPRLAERLIANLVDNALRHNLPGGHVDVVTRTTDASAVLAVSNTGPVVPGADLNRLFQPFQRSSRDRTGHGEGLGLGLSIVQAVADAHGAALSAMPRQGGGLRVEVTFPRFARDGANEHGDFDEIIVGGRLGFRCHPSAIAQQGTRGRCGEEGQPVLP